MFECERNVNQFLMRYCQVMVADLEDERLAEQPHEGVNHPAWILGHLAFTADSGTRLLGATPELPRKWTVLFGPGSKLTSVRSDYFAKAELIDAATKSFERLRRGSESATPEQLAQPTTNPRLKDTLPTAGDVVAFLLTGHLGVHLGQLSMWRRLLGMPPLF